MSSHALCVTGAACGAFAFLVLLPLAIAASKAAAAADRDYEIALQRLAADRAAETEEANAYCWLVPDAVDVAAEDFVKDVEHWLAAGAQR